VYTCLNCVYLAALYTSYSAVYEGGRQRLAISTNASNKRNLFPVAILYSCCTQFYLLNCLRKDAFAACSYANKEALLVYVVGIARLHVVLLHFTMQ
jgi:hypothetical protein